MRVLLSPAYQLELDPKQASNREPYPPLGTMYAASRLRGDGHEVALSDSMLARGTSEFRRDLERFRPDLVALYEDDFNYLSKMCLTNMREAAFEKARLAKEAGAFVVVHGSDATDRLEDYLRAPIDGAIVGEGEETLAELARGLSGDRERIPGLAYLSRGELVRTAPRAFIRDLDTLPFPAWDLVDVERYRGAWLERHDFFSVEHGDDSRLSRTIATGARSRFTDSATNRDHPRASLPSSSSYGASSARTGSGSPTTSSGSSPAGSRRSRPKSRAVASVLPSKSRRGRTS